MPSNTDATPELVNLPGSYEERYAEANRLYNRGEMDQAEAICTRIIDRISGLPARRRPVDSALDSALQSSAILLARIRAQQGDWQAVDALNTRAQTWNAFYTNRWKVDPFLLRIEFGCAEEGIAGLRGLAAAEPENVYLWMTLANAALDAADLVLAEEALDRAEPLALAANDPEDLAALYIRRFQLLQQRQQWHEAARAWEKALKFEPGAEELIEAVVRMFLETGLFDDALRYAEGGQLPAIGVDFYRAWVAQQRGDVVRARHLWRKVLESAPDDDNVDMPLLHALANCWLGQPAAALGLLLEQVATGVTLEVGENIGLALAWAMQDDVESARSNLKLAVQRRALPGQPNRLLSALDWVEFEQLVQNESIKAELRLFFEPPVQPSRW